MKKSIFRRLTTLMVLLCFVSGCAGVGNFAELEDPSTNKSPDEIVAGYMRAVAANPESQKYRMKLLKAKKSAAQAHLKQGRRLASAGKHREAIAEFQLTRLLDPALEVVHADLAASELQIKIDELLIQASKSMQIRRYVEAAKLVGEVLSLDPENPAALALKEELRARQPESAIHELELGSMEPISLEFEKTGAREVFKILSKLSGINFIFDEDVERAEVSVFLENATFAQALELLLKLSGLRKKVLNSRTIILYPEAAGKKYEDHLIQTFYLSNIDAKKAVNLLRTMLQLKKVYVHEELNAIVVRDKPDIVALAKQVLEAVDRGGSEVTFDLELIEINHGDTQELGLELSDYTASVGAGKVIADGTTSIVASTLAPGAATDRLVRSFSDLKSFYTLPAATFNFLKSLSNSEILANPKIRVKNNGKAKVHIGSKEPVITVTINGDNRSDNIQYVDVGVKLDIEPLIQLDGTIVTKLSLEVSSVSNRETTPSGSAVLTLTTTNAQTDLTLEDGEQTVIGGLVRNDVTKSRSSIPFLGDLPFIGALFTNLEDRSQKREILLSITPHVVRNLNLPEAALMRIWSGAEDEFKLGANFGTFAETLEASLAPRPASAVPSKEELDARRLAPILIDPSAATPSKFDQIPLVETPEERGELPGALLSRPGFEEAPPVETEAPAFPEFPAPVEPPTPEEPETPENRQLPLVREVDAEALGTEPDETPAEPDASRPEPSAPAPPLPAEDARVREVDVKKPQVAAAASVARIHVAGPELLDAAESFTLDVRVEDVTNLYSAPLFVQYDPQKLAFVAATEGPFLSSKSEETIFTTSNNAASGRLIVGHKQKAGGQGVSGGGSLFRLEFRAVGKGDTYVEISRINFRDRSGQRLPVEDVRHRLKVR